MAQQFMSGQTKNPGLAAVLSFFWMGLGQIYNGQIAKGIFFIIAYAFSWILMFLIIGFITTPILFIWGVWDAYRSAEKINARAAVQHGYAHDPNTTGI